MHRHLYPLVVAASSASVGIYYLGSQMSESDVNRWTKWMPLRRAYAEALVVQPSIQKGPIEAKTERARADEVEVWKKPSRASEIMRFGYPGYDNLKTYEDFIVSYDRRNRTAHWVMEHLTPDRMVYNSEVDRSKCMFREDPTIHPYFQSRNEDYKRSGYDRGHLAPAGNHRRSQLAIDQTFFLTNMAPQVGKGFNRDKWNDLEKYARHLARECLNIYICTGPLYLPHQEADGCFYVKYKVIGKDRVAVPTHFFKCILIEKSKDQFELEVYLLPNEVIPDEKPLRDFLVPLDAVERAAGFLIFERVPKEHVKKVNGKSTGGGPLRLFG